MRVFVVEGHDIRMAENSFRSEFNHAGITPRLLEGFELSLVTILEEMQVRRHGDFEVVAGIKVTHTEKDGLWTTGYQEHLTLPKGQMLLGGYEVSFWVYGPKGALMRVGCESLGRLHTTYSTALKEVPGNTEHLWGMLKRSIFLSIENGIKHKKSKIAEMLTQREIEKLALLQEFKMLAEL